MIELIAIVTLLSAAFAQDSRSRARRSYVEAVLRRHTEVWLDQMQEHGWFPPGSKTRSFERPTEWDINCGDCEDWAVGARKLLGGKEVWLEQVLNLEPEDLCHCVLFLDGRYYDSQHPDGVIDPEELDLVRKVSRHDYLQRRQFELGSPAPLYATDRLIGIYDYYDPNVRALQHAFKDGDPLALERMCAEMAPFVPTDAVLVAMPDRTGRPTATLHLAKCLAHVTRRPWSEALVGSPRESLRELKHQGKELPELKFWLLGGLPKGRPVVIDNVLDTGTTARAALAAIPNATVLSHAVVTQQIGASLPSPQPEGPWKVLPDGRLLGYRAWSFDPDTNEAISGADRRQRVPLKEGIVHRLSGKGMFLTSSRQYVLDYYAGHELNAICRYAFEPSAVTSGSLADREPEISVREAELLGYDVVDGDGEPWVRRRR